MTKIKLSERVDFTYFIGLVISLILFNISLFFHRDSGLPMIFALVCLGTYIGVIIRGVIDRDSWGKTPKQMKTSAFVGFISIFVIFSMESVLMLTKSFKILGNEANVIFILEGIFLTVIFIVLYTFWFRRVKFDRESEYKEISN